MTYIFGALGVFVGYEHNIAIVPIAAIAIVAIKGDLLLSALVSVGAMTVGFGTSPFNPYTVGISHQIAELELFSGAWYRSIVCVFSLTLTALYGRWHYRKISKRPELSLTRDMDSSSFKLQENESHILTKIQMSVLTIFIIGIAFIIYGALNYGWYFTEISTVFLIITFLVAITARYSAKEFLHLFGEGARSIIMVAFLISLARSIQVVLTDANISDTIIYTLSRPLSHLPESINTVGMVVLHSIINLFIPSGSGQALATMPILIPVSDLIDMSRQTSILAFQIGDGLTNIVNPSLGGLFAMLSLVKVPFDKWLRFVYPLFFALILFGMVFVVISSLFAW